MGSAPVVSLCVPTYNRRDYLRQCLGSVCGQTYADLEIIVCDNASTDGTPELVAGLAAGDPRIRYIRQPTNVGMARNWLSAMQAATGEYLAIVNDDDWLAPHFVAVLAGALGDHADAGFAFGDMHIMNADGGPASEGDNHRYNHVRADLEPGPLGDLLANHLARWRFTIVATLFRTSVLREIGFVDVATGSMLDFDLFIRTGLHCREAVYVRHPVIHYRLHGDQQTTGPGAERRWVENALCMCACLRKYRFADRRLEAIRRERLSWHASCTANRVARRDPARAMALVWETVRCLPGDARTWGRLGMACARSAVGTVQRRPAGIA